MNRVFILSGTAEQARHLARIHDMERSEWAYVADANKMRGHRHQTLWLFGTWRSRSDVAEVVTAARTMEFRIFIIEDAQLGEDDWK
jgi:hypothetical protein